MEGSVCEKVWKPCCDICGKLLDKFDKLSTLDRGSPGFLGSAAGRPG